jgi:hypothetical protein
MIEYRKLAVRAVAVGIDGVFAESGGFEVIDHLEQGLRDSVKEQSAEIATGRVDEPEGRQRIPDIPWEFSAEVPEVPVVLALGAFVNLPRDTQAAGVEGEE